MSSLPNTTLCIVFVLHLPTVISNPFENNTITNSVVTSVADVVRYTKETYNWPLLYVESCRKLIVWESVVWFIVKCAVYWPTITQTGQKIKHKWTLSTRISHLFLSCKLMHFGHNFEGFRPEWYSLQWYIVEIHHSGQKPSICLS